MAYQIKYKVDTFIAPSDAKLGTKDLVNSYYLVRLDLQTQLTLAKNKVYVLSNQNNPQTINQLINNIYANCINIVNTQFLTTETNLRNHFDKFLYKHNWSYFTNCINKNIIDSIDQLPILGFPGSIAFEAVKRTFIPSENFNEYYILKSLIDSLWNSTYLSGGSTLEERLNSLKTYLKYDVNYYRNLKNILIQLNEEGNINFRRWLITPLDLQNLEYKVLFNNLASVIYTEMINTQKACNADVKISNKYNLTPKDINDIYEGLNLQLLIGNGAGTILYYYAAIVELFLDIAEQLKIISYKYKVVQLEDLVELEAIELKTITSLYSEILSIIQLLSLGETTSNLFNVQEWVDYVSMWASISRISVYSPKLGVTDPIEFDKELKVNLVANRNKTLSNLLLNIPNKISSKYLEVKVIYYTDQPGLKTLNIRCLYNSILPIRMSILPNKLVNITIETLPNNKEGSLIATVNTEESNIVNYKIKQIWNMPHVKTR